MNYSHFACKYRQGLSKREINGAAGGYLGWRRGSAAGGGGAIVAVDFPSILPLCFFFSSLSLLCFFVLFSTSSFYFQFFFSFGLAPLFCSLSLSIYPCLPCIYRQKTGEREARAATVLLPHYCPRRHVSSVSPTHGRPRVSLASGCFGWRPFELFRGRKVGENAREQKLPSPVFYTSKGRRRRTVSFKTRHFI